MPQSDLVLFYFTLWLKEAGNWKQKEFEMGGREQKSERVRGENATEKEKNTDKDSDGEMIQK